MAEENRKPNALIHSSSPYLLQHAYNPVDWQPWSQELIDQNKRDGKLLLISIGYSACHWCHVMEHHCFEDQEVADFMNKHFVNIKVDREERPDIDHIYMDALQLMSGQGGWPLNVVALPDQRPFWGATYLPKDRWLTALTQLVELHHSDPQRVKAYASNMHEGLRQQKLVPSDLSTFGEAAKVDDAIYRWASDWDDEFGGNKRAPKFMMPATLDLLMQYGWSRKDKAVLEHARNTLTRMAWGGVHDVAGGGFARYSVDARWHVPHFEKMLYDNGLLLRTYADAYSLYGDPLFREAAEGICNFLQRELRAPEGGLHSALDADSTNNEGISEEGAYYVWTTSEINEILTHREAEAVTAYFNLGTKAHWEEGRNVLFRDREAKVVAKELGMEWEAFEKTIEHSLAILRNHREANRKPPGLDSKIIASWNAMTAAGLARAYRIFGDDKYLDMAVDVANFMDREMRSPDGFLRRTYGKDGLDREGYLDDYAFLVSMLLEIYQSTYLPEYLLKAVRWTEYALERFGQEDSPLLAYTSGEALIRQTVETEDNVIPSSNAVMCENLWILGRFFPSRRFGDRARDMLKEVYATAIKHPNYYAKWLSTLISGQQPFYEIAGMGPGFDLGFKELWKDYHPHRIFAGSIENTDFPEVLSGKSAPEGSPRYYACQHGNCRLPAEDIETLQTQIQ